jgi:cytochrome c-type biogenesis protein CcmH
MPKTTHPPMSPTAEITGRPSRRLVVLLALAVLLLAGVLYAVFGTPAALREPAPPPPVIDAHGNPQIAEMVARLAERMKQQPQDAEGWSMLGRSYLVLGKPAEAVDALRKRLALEPRDALAMADLADALALQQGRRFEGEPETLLRAALAADPKQPKALELAGTMAFDRGDFKGAVAHWSSAADTLAAAEPGSRAVQNLRAGIEEAQRRGGLAPAPAAQVATAGARISGKVEVAAALKARVRPDDTVLIFARVVDGPRMPVAVLKRRGAELPLAFVLDDSTAMSPNLKLSPSTLVIVGVRVSRSGQAAAQPGDLQGFSDPVAVGTAGLRITIDQVVREGTQPSR